MNCGGGSNVARMGLLPILHESGVRRNAPPLVETCAQCTFVRVREDKSVSRLEALIALRPRGILYCQTSWHGDCEWMQMDTDIPVACLPYEAGEELKCVLERRAALIRFKTQTGALFRFKQNGCEYMKSLHECRVRSIACGNKHAVACTEGGHVYAWEETPQLVDEVSNLAKGCQAFAGANQTFVVAELPFQSILYPA